MNPISSINEPFQKDIEKTSSCNKNIELTKQIKNLKQIIKLQNQQIIDLNIKMQNLEEKLKNEMKQEVIDPDPIDEYSFK